MKNGAVKNDVKKMGLCIMLLTESIGIKGIEF